MRRRSLAVVLSAPERPAPTYPEYGQLVADATAAANQDGGFVDPARRGRPPLLHPTREG